MTTAGRKKGTPRTGGRQKGSKNHATTEAKQAATNIVDDPLYRLKLRLRALAGELPPALETMLWHYSKGKPTERLEISTPGDFAKLTDAELAEELIKALGTIERRSGVDRRAKVRDDD
jgi:hypothetical protein